MVADHYPEQDRLTQVEIGIAVLKASQINMENAITRMADSMQQLAAAELERKYDRQTMQQNTNDYVELEKCVKALQTELTDYKLEQERKENAKYKTLVLKVLGLSSLVIATLITDHFSGTHLIS
jgi:hypothetical protein